MQRLMKIVPMFALCFAIVASALAVPLAGAAPEAGPQPAKAVSITLHASFSAPAGWGWATTNITNPGPTLTVTQGDVITFHLLSNDSMEHELIIDLNNNRVNDTGDQFSRRFSSPTTATDFTYTAGTAGTFNYFCGIHGYAAQHGSLVVQATGGGGGGTTGGIDTTLLIGGVVIIVAIVAVVAAIVMRRKKP
jgi:heme/copper-type cytochrome/quinol oxidase subunit 2